MVKLIIDDKQVTVNDGATILEAAIEAGSYIPTLCFLKDCNEIGACRLCVVEVEGDDALSTACNTPAEDGMVVHTNNQRVRDARKINAELLISKHNFDCTSCVRNGTCTLQSVAKEFNIIENRFAWKLPVDKWNKEFPLLRDSARCVNCMRCVNICEKEQTIGVWDIAGSGGRTSVAVKCGDIEKSGCTLCGACVEWCPVGALRERDDTKRVFNAIKDENIITVAQISPNAIATWGEHFGLSRAEATEERLVAVLKELGFDHVCNNAASGRAEAEQAAFETSEKRPFLSSACPAWVRFVKTEYPQFAENLSPVGSARACMNTLAKKHFAEDGKEVLVVAVMTCMADKGDDAVDAALTTREFVRMVKSSYINPMTVQGTAQAWGSDTPAAAKADAVCGLGNARRVMEEIQAGKVPDGIVRVAACENGCR